MKKGLFIVSILLIGASVAQAVSNGVLDYFSGRIEGDAVSLEWRSSIESGGLKHYVVERTTSKSEDYKEVGTVKALGSFATYRHKDSRPSVNVQAETQEFQSEPMADLYKYRLKLVYDKEISYSQTISVSKPSSGVKRTWGMIKEMFH